MPFRHLLKDVGIQGGRMNRIPYEPGIHATVMQQHHLREWRSGQKLPRLVNYGWHSLVANSCP
jgi:hypothetical protein